MRILDANINRTGEGLRVVEEFFRFVLEDRQFAEACKNLRHELTAVAKQFFPGLPLARDASADVGASLEGAGEYIRTSPADVPLASCRRAEQALRVLEEYGKLIAAEGASRCEQLRYRVYTLEKVLAVRISPIADRLRKARLYVLIDGVGPTGADGETFRERVKSLVAVGVHVLQLRDKNLDDRTLLARARTLSELVRGTETMAILNDRPDLAALASADGVHVGQEDLSPGDARAAVGAGRAVGVSTHSLEQLRQAAQQGADYLGVGPLFPSETKAFREFPGLAFARQGAAETSLPAFGIGGISLANLASVLETGISRVAVGGSIWRTADPAAEAKRFLDQLR